MPKYLVIEKLKTRALHQIDLGLMQAVTDYFSFAAAVDGGGGG